MKKKKIINILMVICIIIAVGSAGYLGIYYLKSHWNERNVSKLRDKIVTTEVKQLNKDDTDDAEGPEMVKVNGIWVQKKFEQLYKDNWDFMGWIKIEDTNVDYPVMYTPYDSEGGEYYIRRDYNRDKSSAGMPFVDKNCTIYPPTDNIIIYGHNMYSGKMFHDIIKYESKEFWEEHKTITFDTLYGDGEYEVFAAFYGQILPEDSKEFKYYQFVNAGSKEEFDEYIKEIKKKSAIDTDVSVEYGDELLTLSTCAYHVKDGRFAVIAKKKQ